MTWAVETLALTKRFLKSTGWRGILSGLTDRGEPVAVSDPAVDRANLYVHPGELFGLLGPNGAGKTTLIKMLSTLIEPTSGSARVNGFELNQESGIKATTGLVTSDERSFYWRLSGRQNLLFFACLQGLSKPDAAERVLAVLEQVDLQDVADGRFLTYSTGMRQRLSIARALLNKPRLLFLDEPTKGLDPIATHNLHQLIRVQLVDSQGITVLLTTHNLDEAEGLCDRIAIMNHGHIQAVGTIQELRRSLGPGSRYIIQVSRLPKSTQEKLASHFGESGVLFKFISKTHDSSPMLASSSPGDGIESIELLPDQGDQALNEAIDMIRQDRVSIQSVSSQPVSLEQIFTHHLATQPVPPDPMEAEFQSSVEIPIPKSVPRTPTLLQVIPAFFKRDLIQEASYRVSFFLQFFNVFFTVLIFYFISTLVGEAASPYLAQYGGDYFSYVLIGIAFLGYFSTGLSSFSNSLRYAQTTGTLEAMLTTPTSLSVIILSSSLWDYSVTTLRVVVYLLVGIVFLKVDFSGGNYLAAAVVIALTVLSASSLGIIAASFVMVLKRGDPINWGVSTLTAFFGGVYYPVQLLPPALVWISYLLPITYSLDAMRKALSENATWGELLPDLLALVAFAAVLIPLSLLAFRYSVHRAKVEGSLTQY